MKLYTTVFFAFCSFVYAAVADSAQVVPAQEEVRYLDIHPAATHQVVFQFDRRGQTVTGVGEVKSGQLWTHTSGSADAEVLIDLRAVDFTGGFRDMNPLLESWQVFESAEDPWVKLKFHFTNDQATVEAIRNRNVEVTDLTAHLWAKDKVDRALQATFVYPLSRYGKRGDWYERHGIDDIEGESIPLLATLNCIFTLEPVLRVSSEAEKFIGEMREHELKENQPLITPELILGVMVNGTTAVEARILIERAGGDLGALRSGTASFMGKAKKQDTLHAGFNSTQLDTECEARKCAATRGSQTVNSADVLVALATHPSPSFRALLESANLTLESLKAHVNKTALAANLPDSAGNIQSLGNPFGPDWPNKADKQWFPYNVWTIVPYEGRLYFGNGDKNGTYIKWELMKDYPSNNKYKVYLIPLISFDPALKSSTNSGFQREFGSQEPEIQEYRAQNGRLLAPGIENFSDTRQTHSSIDGDIYIRDSKGWVVRATMPDVVHCYDVIDFHGTLYAGVGAACGAAAMVSKDDGVTWTTDCLTPMTPNPSLAYFPVRIYHFFVNHDMLYAVTDHHGVYRLEDGHFVAISVNLFPDVKYPNEATFLERDTPFHDQLVYLGAVNSEDHQWESFGLYAARAVDEPKALSLPDAGMIPYDLKVVGDELYVMANHAENDTSSSDSYDVAVYSTKDLETWTPVVRFKAPTLARSFAYLDGNFYFGLGCVITHPSEHSGEIWRLSMAELK